MLVEIRKIGKEEIPTVSSLDVSDTFTYFDEEKQKSYIREHKAVLRAIRELKCSEKFRGEHFSPSTYIDSRGKEQPYMIMDRDGFTLLVMGFEDPKSMKFKEAYIEQFNAMEKVLIGKIREREKGIAVRQALTKAIQQSNENDRMHGHAYSTYTDVIYKSLFGKTARQFRDELGISKKDSLRDCFAEEDLKRIQNAEMLVSSLIGYGWGYAEIKDFIMDKSLNKIFVDKETAEYISAESGTFKGTVLTDEEIFNVLTNGDKNITICKTDVNMGKTNENFALIGGMLEKNEI